MGPFVTVSDIDSGGGKGSWSLLDRLAPLPHRAAPAMSIKSLYVRYTGRVDGKSFPQLDKAKLLVTAATKTRRPRRHLEGGSEARGDNDRDNATNIR